MNEFIKRLISRAASIWAGWSGQQRIIFAIVAIVVLGGVIALFRVSATPVLTAVFDYPIRDETMLHNIVQRINQDNIRATVTSDGIVRVQDEATARRMRVILLNEGLVPSGISPWEVFDRERWTLTDMERNINFQRAQERMISDHIKAIEGIDNVQLRVVWPTRELFVSAQNPRSVSVTLFPTPGSDITRNRQKIEGIQRILQFAVEGLLAENIVITDHNGMQLNDFAGMEAFDRLSLIERENKFIMDMERRYSDLILNALRGTFSANRVKQINIKFEMDMSRRTIGTVEHFPITMVPRDPTLSYDNSELLQSILRSESTSDISFRGTGFNPEGPAGVEGHIPPAFRDMSNLWGEVNQSVETNNYAINQRDIQEERSPQIDRVTVSVNIDGRWRQVFDAKGNPVILPDGSIEREYIPIPQEDLRRAEALIRDAIGYNPARGDSVTVQNIPYDRTEEFRAEDAEYFRRKQIQTTIIVFLSGFVLLLVGFILFRMISREIERRKRQIEEDRARREQMLRESAMAEAEQDGMDVSISVEERTRMELMEGAINMAKEHPEDTAQLIRTWLLEE